MLRSLVRASRIAAPAPQAMVAARPAAAAAASSSQRWSGLQQRRALATQAHVEPEAPKVPLTFVSMSGQRWNVEGRVGETLLQTIRRFHVPVPGMCNGGGLGAEKFSDGPMCRSCHVYVDNAHVSTLPPKSESEEDLTEWIKNKTANSRFACEIIVDPSVKGMTVVIPEYPDRDVN